MKTVGLFDAKTRFSELCREVAKTGEEIVITRRGQALARLVPPSPAKLTPRKPGRFKGLFGQLGDEALTPLPPDHSGVTSSPTDPLDQP